MRRGPEAWGEGFPYDVPAVAALEELSLDAPITLLAGDNGSGKSTIVEAIAAAMGFAAEGGELERSGELPAVPRPVLGDTLSPVLSATKPHSGYFLRAESVFNIASFVDSGGIFAPDLSLYGDVPLHAQSHGQSFLALLAVMVRAGREGAQFVVATHSPVLPRARRRGSTSSTRAASRRASTTTSTRCASRAASSTPPSGSSGRP